MYFRRNLSHANRSLYPSSRSSFDSVECLASSSQPEFGLSRGRSSHDEGRVCRVRTSIVGDVCCRRSEGRSCCVPARGFLVSHAGVLCGTRHFAVDDRSTDDAREDWRSLEEIFSRTLAAGHVYFSLRNLLPFQGRYTSQISYGPRCALSYFPSCLCLRLRVRFHCSFGRCEKTQILPRR